MSSALLHLLYNHFILGILNKALILAQTLRQTMLHYQLASSIMLVMEFSMGYTWSLRLVSALDKTNHVLLPFRDIEPFSMTAILHCYDPMAAIL